MTNCHIMQGNLEMADFTSEFWSWFIIVLVVLSFIGIILLLRWMSVKEPSGDKPQTMGHVWDEDLEELNNPLPMWWLVMFYITIVFGIVYLALYPGLGNIKGLLDWTQESEYTEEIRVADEKYEPLFLKYSQTDLAQLSKDKEAMKTGERLFINYCNVCHGSDARGATGFPNLRDTDWLYGGEAETIKTTIMHGRQGMMPPWKDMLSNADATNVVDYVLSLSGRRFDQKAAESGKVKFEQLCIACHGADGTGNKAMGAPNLTDGTWLYGGSKSAIRTSILNGRNGNMPAMADFLGETRVHLLAAYIYSLSNESE